MHYKRRKRKRGGIKGCCWACSRNRRWGLRNERLLTKQELASLLTLKEENE